MGFRITRRQVKGARAQGSVTCSRYLQIFSVPAFFPNTEHLLTVRQAHRRRHRDYCCSFWEQASCVARKPDSAIYAPFLFVDNYC